MTRRSPVPPYRDRPGFASLLDRIEAMACVRSLSRTPPACARADGAELGITLLINRGVRLLTASGDHLTASDDPTSRPEPRKSRQE